LHFYHSSLLLSIEQNFDIAAQLWQRLKVDSEGTWLFRKGSKCK
jgi:hypothetical protein